MAQKQLDKFNFKLKSIDQSTQTGDLYEFIICLTKTKRARVYYSESYKDYVLSLNYGTCKKFIITRSMWKIIEKKLELINHIFKADGV